MKFIRLQRNADTTERGAALPAEINNAEGGGYVPEPGRVELTFGEMAVRLQFNLNDDADIRDIKMAASKLIDVIHEKQKRAESEGNGEKIAMCKLAIREVQSSVHWAVQAVTWPY